MRYLISILLLLTINLKAEVIDGPANVRDTINGEILFELVDSAIVYASEPYNGWHKLQVMVVVDSSDITEEFVLKPNVPLIDYYRNGPLIGYSKSYIKPYDYFSYYGKYVVFIEGYTYKNNIKPESILENGINKILLDKTDIFKKDLVEYFAANDFADPISEGDFEIIRIYDLIPETPLIRCAFIFDNREKLAAILNKDRTINYPFAKEEIIVRDYTLNYLNYPNENLKDTIDMYLRSID